MDPFKRLTPGEARALARLAIERGAPLGPEESEQLIRARRIAELDGMTPARVRLRTAAYVLMLSPDEIRALIDAGRLDATLMSPPGGRRYWVIPLEALKAFAAERRRQRLTADLAKRLAAVKEESS